MSKENIAFVVVRYGLNINGGAEYHCRMLAERLTNDYNVEVLTTCVDNIELEKILSLRKKRLSIKSLFAVLKLIPLILNLKTFIKRKLNRLIN